MSIFSSIAEQRIREAIERGDLDDLSLKGRAIPPEDLSHVPEELRMGYKVLKNAGYLPEELQLHQELVRLKDLLQSCEDPQEQRALRERITLRQLQFDQLMERNGGSLAVQEYRQALVARLLPR